MSPSTAAVAVAALAGLAAASPVQIYGRSTFKLHQVAVPRTHVHSHARKIVNAVAKFGGDVSALPDDLIDGATGASGSVVATPLANDEAYLCPVSIGGQTLSLDFDTGSADLWVFSTELPSSEINGQTQYDPSKSGKKVSGESWKITYGDQSGSSGDVYADTVVIGNVTATSQSVEAATSVSSQFTQDSKNDGLVGLAFGDINTCTPNQCTTFFDTVKSSLASPLFAARLKHGEPGSYDFGAIDSSQYTGQITYVPVDNSKGFWGFTAGSLSVNGQSIGSGGDAIADTGTTLLLLSDESVVDKYWGSVQGASQNSQAGGYTFPCSATPPDLDVEIGGATFTVPGAVMNQAEIGDGTCMGGLQYAAGLPSSIFGDVFLKSMYVIFDQSQSSPRLGFAKGA